MRTDRTTVTLMSNFQPPGKRILAIDGGGYRGLGCLLIIDDIMKKVEEICGQALLPCQVFDLVCGTSTGGLIAILLGRFGLDCHTTIKAYKQLGSALFGTSEREFWNSIISSPNLDSQAYDEALANLVARYCGDRDRLMASPKDDTISHETTETFVTIVPGAPYHSNRTYRVRSYDTPKRGVLPPPIGHNWCIREAARATSAAPIYLSPLVILYKSIEHSSKDPGFSAFNNPTDLALLEANKLWPKGEIGVVVSLGTGFLGLAPPDPTLGWNATDIYAEPFVKEMLAKVSTPSVAEGQAQKRALFVVKQLVSLAVDTELMHNRVGLKAGTDVYFRLNPPLGLGNVDLVDYFHADRLEDEVEKWLATPEGRTRTGSIANKLVKQLTIETERHIEPPRLTVETVQHIEPLQMAIETEQHIEPLQLAIETEQHIKLPQLTIETARQIEPPPPPQGTNSGYNPQLDKTRPETMIEYLQNYHVIFVIDDSRSMKREGRWDETRDALASIADYTFKYNTATVDMCFINSRRVCTAIKGAPFIMSTFKEVQPSGRTPTGATLNKLLNTEITKLDAAIDTPAYKEIKPLDIIFLTDGVPDDRPGEVLVAAHERLKKSKHHPNCIGIQFVQIGNDPKAEVALKELMNGNIGNIVDTIPYRGRGVLSPEKLERILLGGVQPNVRAMIKV